MRWPWGRRADESSESVQAVEQSAEALTRALEALRAAHDGRPEVREVTGEIAEYRKRNHFGEAITAIMRGHL